MKLLEHIHETYVFGRRVRVLSRELAAAIPTGTTSVLDVGCGDGLMAKTLMGLRPELRIDGVDVFVRPTTHIPVKVFDGYVLPHGDRTFDVVMFVDVLHHTDDPTVLLREAARVARRAVVIKDHTAEGLLAMSTLRLMDELGNARHGVALPYNYWRRAQWQKAFETIKLRTASWKSDLHIYPPPATWLFDWELHFVACLEPGATSATSV